MAKIDDIVKAIDNKLLETGKEHLILQQASKLLLSLGIIESTKELKQILERGEIPHAYKTNTSPRQWLLPLSEEGRSRKAQLDKKNQKQTSKPTNDQREKKTYKGILFISIVIISMVLVNVNPTDNSSKVQNNGLDASVYQVEQFLEDHLNDPDSYDPIEWSAVQKTKNGYYVRHKYRARNGFGGMNIENKIFYLDEDGNVTRYTDY